MHSKNKKKRSVTGESRKKNHRNWARIKEKPIHQMKRPRGGKGEIIQKGGAVLHHLKEAKRGPSTQKRKHPQKKSRDQGEKEARLNAPQGDKRGATR